MFTCPKCGSHEYKTLKPLRDGTVERECAGTIMEKMIGPKGMGESFAKMDALPEEHKARFMQPRRCFFIWKSADDGLYGVEEETAQ